MLESAPAMAQQPCPPVLCLDDCSGPVQQSCEAPEPSGWLGVPQPPFGLTETGTTVMNRCGSFQGTPEDPVIVTVTTTQDCTIQGSYIIMDNSDVAELEIFGDHIAVRNSRVHHADTGSMLWIVSGSTDIVIWNNEVDHNAEIPSDADRHGISMGANVDRIWILDNHIHENSGDGIQFCHGCDTGQGPRTVYISGNVIHDDEENAMDFKEFTGPIIVTQNEMYGYEQGVFSGNGDALRINDEGSQGELWIVANVFHDNELDINPQGADATSYILDNGNASIFRPGDAEAVESGAGAQQYYDLYESKYGISIRP